MTNRARRIKSQLLQKYDGECLVVLYGFYSKQVLKVTIFG